MSILNLPRELIIEVISHCEERTSFFYEIEYNRGTETEIRNMKQLIAEYPHLSEYYAPTFLYGTSKEFTWLKDYDFIQYERWSSGSTLRIYNINMRYNGIMLYGCFDNVVCGYAYRENCKLVYENAYCYEDDWFYRRIDGEIHYAVSGCLRWGNNCKAVNCAECAQLDIITSQIFTLDPYLEHIIRYGDIWKFYIRKSNNVFKDVKFKYTPLTK
jgi:hypothetical protein